MILLGDRPPTFSEVAAVARDGARVSLSPSAVDRMERSHRLVEEAANDEQRPPAYGVVTGFGALASARIPADERGELQHALLRSHAAGMGPPMAVEVVRAEIFLRARTLAMGFSGVRPRIAEALLDLLNAGITPYVPVYGSLGASGDLAPLAHAALCLLGEGWVLPSDGRLAPEPARARLDAAGLQPVTLHAKEGLALLNGTDGMLGMLVLACVDARRVLATADVACAMSVEALLGTDRSFAPELNELRPHPGQRASAANVAALLAGSPIVASHRDSEHAVQDAYSLRCHPQVAGAARDTLRFAEEVATRELAAAVDNPVVLPDGRIESTGNFHGEPLAFACDFLAIALAELGAIAERRVDHLLDPKRSRGLPPFLAPDAGVNSGLMIAQYTAAALVAENRRHAAPASVDSLPTSGMQEDHVSMGWAAAHKLHDVLRNVERIIGIEALCAAWGLWQRAPLAPAAGTGAVVAALGEVLPRPGPDQFLAPHLAAAEHFVRTGTAITAAESTGVRLQ